MRIRSIAIAVAFAGAALPVVAQDNQSAPAISSPPDSQTAPRILNVPGPPGAGAVPETPAAPSPANPPSAENAPAAPPAPNPAAPAPVPRAPGAAENVAPPMPAAPPPPPHYVFNRVDNGYLRLDNQTGQVAFCSAHSVGWACEAVPEDRAALEKEIARLQSEVATLKAEVSILREPPPPPRPPETVPPAIGKGDDAAKLREDLARARAAFDNAWRRLVDMILAFQKDMMPKG